MATGMGKRELVADGEQRRSRRVTDRPGAAEEENAHWLIVAGGTGQRGVGLERM